MENENKTNGNECRLGAGPFLFSGIPSFIHGTVELINPSPEKVRVRTVAIDSPELKPHAVRRVSSPTQAPVTEETELPQVRVRGRIGPFGRARLSAQLAFNSSTPPGEYKAQVRFGDQQAPAVIFILEDQNLRVVPEQIALAAAPGERLKRSVYITNEGNVPFNTRRAAFAPLKASGMLHESLAVALNEAGHQGHAKFLDRFVSELAGHEVPPAKVKIDLKEEDIAPDETKCVEITIQLPADIKRRQIYTSTISFGDAELSVKVEVNGKDKKTNGGRDESFTC